LDERQTPHSDVSGLTAQGAGASLFFVAPIRLANYTQPVVNLGLTDL
jgi:hypothetical protein